MAELTGVGLPDSVTIAEGEGGLPVLRVSAPAGVGQVYLHGAHVTAWAPSGKAPVIWMSRKSMFEPGQPIRGGVPICFPWFGPGRNGDRSPAHGFARLAAWTLTSARADGSTVTAALRLTDGDVADLPGTELWPHRFEADYRACGPEVSLSP
jgi:glucose-6-phosphate 1-epimerase